MSPVFFSGKAMALVVSMILAPILGMSPFMGASQQMGASGMQRMFLGVTLFFRSRVTLHFREDREEIGFVALPLGSRSASTEYFEARPLEDELPEIGERGLEMPRRRSQSLGRKRDCEDFLHGGPQRTLARRTGRRSGLRRWRRTHQSHKAKHCCEGVLRSEKTRTSAVTARRISSNNKDKTARFLYAGP